MRERVPSPLQEAVLHAERFAEQLRTADRDLLESHHANPREPSEAERWIVGRDGEVEAFVNDVVREYRAELRSLVDTTAMIDGFVASMHASFASVFGRVMTACCAHGDDLARVAATSASASAFVAALRTQGARPLPAISIMSAEPTPRNA